MLLQIVAHTPKWVFAVFVLLLWLGGKQLLAGRVALGRATAVPLAMVGFSFYGVASAFGGAPSALAGWAAAGVVLAALVLRLPLPATTRYDAASRSFEVAGSAVPLALMMGIFLTKYVVGASLAMHPEMARDATFAIAVPALYGVFSGIFAGRGIRLWKFAIRQDRVLTGTTAA